MIKFNDPKRHKHKIKQVQRLTLLALTSNVTTLLEKSFVTRKSFHFLCDVFEKLVEASVMYADYIETNLESVNSYQNIDENVHQDKVDPIPFLEQEKVSIDKYSKKDKIIVANIIEKLSEIDFYDVLPLNDMLPSNAALRFNFFKNLKKLAWQYQM